MDDRPGLEIIVGRQVSDQVVRSVSVYRFTSGFSRQLMTASYSRIVTEDFDQNGREDLFLIYPGQTEDSPAAAVLYSFRDDQMYRSAEINLSAPADELKRVTLSKLSEGSPAVYATMAQEESYLLTDVFVVRRGQIDSVLTGHKTETLSNYYVYPEDIDSDGVTEVPILKPLQVQQDAQKQYLIEWYASDNEGVLTKKTTTYHNQKDGWYMRLDFDWVTSLTVEQTEDAFDFLLLEQDQQRQLFSILILTGPDRDELAKEEGLHLLHRGETEVYVLSVNEEMTEVDCQELLGCFRLIRMDWNNEEIRGDEDEEGSDSGR